MAFQYPLPFTPPLAWWEARDAELVRDRLIDRALSVASLDLRWPWGTRGGCARSGARRVDAAGVRLLTSGCAHKPRRIHGQR